MNIKLEWECPTLEANRGYASVLGHLQHIPTGNKRFTKSKTLPFTIVIIPLLWGLPQEKNLNSWLKPENLVSIINEFYQGYCKLMSFQLEGKKGGKKRKRESQEERPNRISPGGGGDRKH